jgi:hypothetical protein
MTPKIPKSQAKGWNADWARQVVSGAGAAGVREDAMTTGSSTTLSSIGPATAADGCGPGCHSAISGVCVVDGWGTGASRSQPRRHAHGS